MEALIKRKESNLEFSSPLHEDCEGGAKYIHTTDNTPRPIIPLVLWEALELRNLENLV